MTIADLPAADELYDLKLRAGAENRFGPEGWLDDAAVQFRARLTPLFYNNYIQV